MKKKVVLIGLMITLIFSFTGCTSWERTKKNWSTEMNEGLNREVIVYSSTGEEIWRFEGKIDIDYTDERILFDDENNKRHTIYFKGGTVIVNEL
jgi:uncharacterized lipoprotein YehR (DUF1307 family)